MTQEEIIELAKEAGLTWVSHNQTVRAFAQLVAAKEREECAEICDDRAFKFFSESPFFVEMHGLADVIRTRGES